VLDYVNNVTVTEGFWDNLGSNTLADGGVVEALNMQSDERQDNSIVWIAPKYAGLPLELALQYSADESFVSKNSDRNNGYGASLMFDQGTGFTAGVAYTKDMDASHIQSFNTGDLDSDGDIIFEDISKGGDVIRGTATVDLGKFIAAPVMLGALYQQTDYDGRDDKEKGLVVSAEMGLANFARPASVYLQYNKTDNLAGLEDYDSDQIVLGGKYMYKDNMIAHAYIGQNSADWEDNDADVFAVGGGLEYLF
ncbi:MAG: porin, partial [Psychrobacter sp.]|nr:porin [Psychrobacter sp.]